MLKDRPRFYACASIIIAMLGMTIIAWCESKEMHQEEYSFSQISNIDSENIEKISVEIAAGTAEGMEFFFSENDDTEDFINILDVFYNESTKYSLPWFNRTDDPCYKIEMYTAEQKISITVFIEEQISMNKVSYSVSSKNDVKIQLDEIIEKNLKERVKINMDNR